MQLNSISAALTQLLLIKIVFLLLNIPHPPFSMLEYNNNYALKQFSFVSYNIEKVGWGREAKEKSKVLTFPTLLTMIVGLLELVGLLAGLRSS